MRRKYAIPAAGAIELMAATKAEDFVLSGQRTRLALFPRDEFGTRTVTLTPLIAPK